MQIHKVHQYKQSALNNTICININTKYTQTTKELGLVASYDVEMKRACSQRIDKGEVNKKGKNKQEKKDSSYKRRKKQQVIK